MKKLLFLISEDQYFCSHRLNLAKAAKQAGFFVAVATRCRNHIDQIQKAGIQIFPLKYLERASLNPITQLLLFWELMKIYKTYKPDIVHHVAMKPVMIGSLVALYHRVPRIINALGGLGYLFTEGVENKGERKFKKKTLRYIVCQIFRFIFRQPNSRLILQNKDDLNTLIQKNVVDPTRVSIIEGAGVDINAFPVTSPPEEPPVIITCISRMLWDKGIGELVEAAAFLKQQSVPIKIILYGMPDEEQPSSIQKQQLEAWQQAGFIDWAGHCSEVAKAYANCHIAVLPSYREGLPKSLLEAASCGRPIVTTDVPGCREVVIDQENGLLVPAKDAQALANALNILIHDPHLRAKMGTAGRKRVEKYFSDTLIHQQTINLYLTSN